MSATNLKQREFNIYGNKIVFYDVLLDTAYVMNEFARLKKHYTDLIHRHYVGIGKLDGFMQKADEILFDAQMTFFQTTVEELKKQNCDAGMEIRGFFSYPEEVSEVYDCWEKLNSYYAEETDYIPQKRWCGGGFGVAGAIKGAITAGAFNAVGNFIGSIKHSSDISRHNIGVDRAKKKFYRDKGFEETFKYAIAYLAEMAEVAFKSELLEMYGCDVYENIDYETAVGMYFNMVDYPENITGENVAKTLQVCPYLPDTYMLALNNLEGDTTELGLLYGLCLRNDVFDNERRRKHEILSSISSGKFSVLLNNYKEDKSISLQIKNTVFEEYKARAVEVFNEALNGGDTSQVEDMVAFTLIMLNYLENANLLFLAGKVCSEPDYGVEFNPDNCVLLFSAAAKYNHLKSIEQLIRCYYIYAKTYDKDYEKTILWGEKALELNPNSMIAHYYLAQVYYHHKTGSINIHTKLIRNLEFLSRQPYSAFWVDDSPVRYCYYMGKVYSSCYLKDDEKAISWYSKGAYNSNDEWGIICCSAVIPTLQSLKRYDEMVKIALPYQGRYIGADYALGFAYCRGDGILKNYDMGAKCFLSVINNYNDENHQQESYQTLKQSAQAMLNKMVCKNGVWKKKMFESI